MLLLIPLGPQTQVPRLPRVTAGLIGICLAVFLFTWSADSAKVGEEEARLERIAEWTLTGPFRQHPELEAARKRQPTALAFLARETAWQEAVPEPDRSRLVHCLDDHRRLTGSHPFYRFGLIPSRVTVVSLLTHLFVHADFLHLLFNMIVLWAVGGLLEATWGRVFLIVLYLVSGAAAALAHVSLNAGSTTPAIGASGAVAGLMGAFAVAHTREPMRVAFVMALAVAPRIRIYSLPAVLFLGFWFLEQLFWWVGTAGMSVEIAFGAHVCGFAFGLLAGTLLRSGFLRPDEERAGT